MKIIFENENLYVFYKPSGLVVNKSETSPGGTLQDYLIDELNFSYDHYSEDDFLSRTGLVHRLDKDTSGVLLVAKNKESFAYFQHQFKERRVSKEYLAVVYGNLVENEFEVDAPIARNRKHRMKYAISKDGKDAVTRFIVNKRMQLQDHAVSVLTCLPYTGRTHQLRVHLCAMGTPILGDIIYGGKRQLKWAFGSEVGITRLMLHATRLGIYLNEKDTDMTWFVAESPQEFVRFL